MTPEQAVTGIAYLVAATQGWNDEAVELYVHECTHLRDPEIFLAAMRNLSLHWNKSTRPLMYDLTSAYQAEVRDRLMAAPALPAETGEILTLEEGTRVARAAYQSECRRQDRVGSEEIFDHWIATLTSKRAQRLAKPGDESPSDERV